MLLTRKKTQKLLSNFTQKTSNLRFIFGYFVDILSAFAKNT